MDNNSHPLRCIVEQNNQGKHIGIFSVCSSNPMVLRAAIRDAVVGGYSIIIESTANQVNQFGGYTGMCPSDFVQLVHKIAEQEGLPLNQIILGGDHLGPLIWTDYPETEAMEYAKELIRSYILSGYSKIHLDTSMKVADDVLGPLDARICARRGAELALTALQAFKEYSRWYPEALSPVFVVGSEVPIPGGSQDHIDSLQPTNAKDYIYQFEVFKSTFEEYGIDFNQVIAFVVQPGIEYGDDFVIQYDRKKALELTSALKIKTGTVFEGHSTDYQTETSLKHLVEDGIGILKVGPALTFRMREALQKMEHIECILIQDEKQRSNCLQTLLDMMDEDNKYWKKYYHGNEQDIRYKKIFSYSDRCRYYLSLEKVNRAITILLNNLKYIPEALLSLYFPNQYKRHMNGQLLADAYSIIIDDIQEVCHKYATASGLIVQTI